VILLGLRMRNFRQHADSEILFAPGLTGIIGPNGAGKSTILEAIAWAIYGSEAARGTNETIRFSRAAPRARVEVELEFAVGGREFRVVRTLGAAEVFADGRTTPAATSTGGVTRYLRALLGMSRREFFNTYFTGQKELQFLAAMGPTERGRFLSQVLGYERLRHAQDLLRSHRSELRSQIEGLRAGMGDPDTVRAEVEAATLRLEDARAAVQDARADRARAADVLADLAPRWASVQAARERHRELTHAVEAADAEAASVARELERLDGEIRRSEEAAEALGRMRERLEALPATAAECDRLAELARVAERRTGLAESLRDLDQELERIDERLRKVESAPDLLTRYAEELATARALHEEVRASFDEARTAWLRDRQDADTKLQGFRERGHELKEQIRTVRELGEAGACPTCGRPLGAGYPRLLAELEEQWATVVQDGKWWKSRREQLEEMPAETRALEARVAEVGGELEALGRRHARCESAVHELGALREDREARAARRDAVRAELGALPDGYDAEAHTAARARLAELQALERDAARLEESAARGQGLAGERASASERAAQSAARRTAAADERTALGFSEAAFERVRGEHEAAAEALRQRDLRAVELQGVLTSAEGTLEAARAADARIRAQIREVAMREDDFRHHDELDRAYKVLRGELNARVRPELSELASEFLAQLTDGRYTSLEISDSYDILVLDEGEEKPVISGGEEDVANLVLRLSLSQMIAERAGHPLSLLILDEVFGSLDIARRDNVVQLLRRLENRFEQVILITHIEGIREALDQVLTVRFDERTGASVVRQESLPGSGPPPPGFGLAAD
jgi:DNA repair protein SbcC/Rad50